MNCLHGCFGPQRRSPNCCRYVSRIAASVQVKELPEAGTSGVLAVRLTIPFECSTPARLLAFHERQQKLGVELEGIRELAQDLPATVQKLKEYWRVLAAARVASLRKHVPEAAKVFLNQCDEAADGAVMRVEQELRHGGELRSSVPTVTNE